MTIEAVTDALTVDYYFLSATNPFATAGQRDAETPALALMATSRFQKLWAITGRRWRDLAGASPSQ